MIQSKLTHVSLRLSLCLETLTLCGRRTFMTTTTWWVISLVYEVTTSSWFWVSLDSCVGWGGGREQQKERAKETPGSEVLVLMVCNWSEVASNSWSGVNLDSWKEAEMRERDWSWVSFCRDLSVICSQMGLAEAHQLVREGGFLREGIYTKKGRKYMKVGRDTLNSNAAGSVILQPAASIWGSVIFYLMCVRVNSL